MLSSSQHRERAGSSRAVPSCRRFPPPPRLRPLLAQLLRRASILPPGILQPGPAARTSVGRKSCGLSIRPPAR